MKELKSLKIWEHQFAYEFLATECANKNLNPDLLMLQLIGNAKMTEEENESLVLFICAIGESCKQL
jgi:hypothetical protein